ncbi:hypothetical protein C8T65DRAFT_86321 [Cerioporus squamosus]|nr:hypothetical protein C8T65DRAFT_86321 [Cerioporus squamosus]
MLPATTAYIPFARLPLPRLLCRCEALQVAVNWNFYPSTYLASLPILFPALTELHLYIDHLSASSIFRCIWALPALRTLALSSVSTTMYNRNRGHFILFKDSLTRILETRRKAEVCVRLRSLNLAGLGYLTFPNFPPGGGFGNCVTNLEISIGIAATGAGEVRSRLKLVTLLIGWLPQRVCLRASCHSSELCALSDSPWALIRTRIRVLTTSPMSLRKEAYSPAWPRNRNMSTETGSPGTDMAGVRTVARPTCRFRSIGTYRRPVRDRRGKASISCSAASLRLPHSITSSSRSTRGARAYSPY